jgi:hypothetical protein
VFFQAAMKVVLSHLNGTFRLIVSPGSPRRYSAPTGMLFCAYPVMTIKIMGAFKMRLRQYCGPERTPPGYSGSAQVGNGFMTQDTNDPLRSNNGSKRALRLRRYLFLHDDHICGEFRFTIFQIT